MNFFTAGNQECSSLLAEVLSASFVTREQTRVIVVVIVTELSVARNASLGGPSATTALPGVDRKNDT